MQTIAILGRPNVGKSTLFNRLIRSNRAITHDHAGITRDRLEGRVKSRSGKEFMLLDTGGITLDAHQGITEVNTASSGFAKEIFEQAKQAIEESVAICFVVDGKEGLTPFDEHLAAYIRKTGKKILLAVNKVDGIEKEDETTAEFHVLGFPIIAVSAEHGHNVRFLEESLGDLLPDDFSEEQQKTPTLRLAMLGRPNAGKSSLINAITGTARLIVSDVAGTTRDSIDVSLEYNDNLYVFVDTAGIRRKAKITDTIERYSVNSSIKSTTKSDVTLLVIDAVEGLTQQDKKLIDLLNERKTPFMILLNKMDLIRPDERKKLKMAFEDALSMCQHVPILNVSALKNKGLTNILPTATQIFDEGKTRIGTGQLNRVMEQVIAKHQPAVVKRVRPKFFYLTQAETCPPTFVFFVSDAERITQSYERYLEKSLRRLFGIKFAPIRVKFRSSHKK